MHNYLHITHTHCNQILYSIICLSSSYIAYIVPQLYISQQSCLSHRVMSELYVFFIILPYLILSKHTHRQTKHVYQETSHQGLYPSIGSLLTFSQMAPMAPCLHACVINQINQIARNSHRMLLLTDETYPIAESPKPHPT